MLPCNRCSRRPSAQFDRNRLATRNASMGESCKSSQWPSQGFLASSPRHQGSIVSKGLLAISREFSDDCPIAISDPRDCDNSKSPVLGAFTGLRSTKLRCTKIKAPKLMIQPAAKGCARTCQLGRIEDQLHAATESRGSVPNQNAIIVATVITAFGAAADARTNR